MLSKASSSLSFLTSQSAPAPTPEEDKLKTFALAVSYRTNNNSLDGLQVPDKETIVSSCFCHSSYIRYGSKYYIRNPAVNPGDSFSKYDEFLVKLEEWLSKTRIISPVPPGAPTYNSKGLLSLHSRGEVFSIYQRLFQNFFNSCEKENSLSPLDVKTILQSVFSIDNIRQVDPDLADYLGTRQSEIYHLKEPTDAEPLEQFLNMLYLKQGVTDRAWKLRAEPLCEFEFNRKSYRELLLMMKHKMGLQPNDEFSGYFPQSIINLTNPANSKNLATMPTEMDLSDLISVRSWLRQYVRSIRRDEQNVDNFMLDINDVRQKWNILFRRTPLEVEFGNPGLTRIVFCTNLFMRLLEGMLLFFLNTVDSKPYTKDPILTSGKKISDLTIFQLLDYFKNIRMWTVTHGCQGVETSNARVRLTIVRDILTKQSQALLSQMTQQTQDTQLSQEELGFFDSVISGASRLLDKCTDALTCVFGTNCSSSGSTVLYTGTDDDPGGAAAAERPFEDQELEITSQDELDKYQTAKRELLQKLEKQEVELEAEASQAEALRHSSSFAASSAGYGSSLSEEEDLPIETQLERVIDDYERRQSQSQAFGVPGEEVENPGVELQNPSASAAEIKAPAEVKSPLASAIQPIYQIKMPTTSKQSNRVPDEYIVSSNALDSSPEEARFKYKQNLPLSGYKSSRNRDEPEEEEGKATNSSKKDKGYNYLETLRLQVNEIGREIVKLQNNKKELEKLPKSTTDPKTNFTQINKGVQIEINNLKSRITFLTNLKKDKNTEIKFLEEKGGSKRSKTRKYKRRQHQTKKNPKKKRTVNKRRQHKKRRTNKH
jgi:hypothetical protein